MRLICAISLLTVLMPLHAQRLTRPVPRGHRSVTTHVRTTAYDTVRGTACDSVTVSGYDKTLRAVRESMFITNMSALAIAAVELTVDYLDTSGRQIHKASHTVECDIPPGETRRVEVPTFDRAGAFYYRLSAPPRRSTQATPFDVAVTVTALIYKPETTTPQ